MAHHVYANGMEIASKSSDGKSAGAFPDVCFTPPVPPATGFPIPYANTCFATKITNGSTSVFIKGKTIALEDKSYFKDSLGDVSATQGLKKGIVSANVDGRAFFIHWSPNVKVEGFGVPRHLDMVTHNHSNPSNTALFPFQSRSWIFKRHDCNKEEKRIEKACEPKKAKDKNKHWTENNCKGLGAKVINGSIDSIKKDLEDNITDIQEQLKNLDVVQKITETFTEEVTSWALQKLGAVGVKAVGKQAIGSFLPLIGNAVMAASTAADLYAAKQEIAALTEQAAQIKEYSEKATQKFETAKSNLNSMMKDGKVDFPDLDTEDGRREFRKQAGDIQDGIATLNDCTRARKCNLVPHGSKSNSELNRANSKNVEPATNGGCCKGQTGHHLLPDTLIKDAACTKYKFSQAPTVCAEGGKDNGSHGRIHDSMDLQLKKAANDGKFVNNAIPLDDALDAAANSHMKAFPLSLCSKKCIRSQLDDYYKTACDNQSNPMLSAKDKNGNPVKPAGDYE